MAQFLKGFGSLYKRRLAGSGKLLPADDGALLEWEAQQMARDVAEQKVRYAQTNAEQHKLLCEKSKKAGLIFKGQTMILMPNICDKCGNLAEDIVDVVRWADVQTKPSECVLQQAYLDLVCCASAFLDAKFPMSDAEWDIAMQLHKLKIHYDSDVGTGAVVDAKTTAFVVCHRRYKFLYGGGVI